MSFLVGKVTRLANLNKNHLQEVPSSGSATHFILQFQDFKNAQKLSTITSVEELMALRCLLVEDFAKLEFQTLQVINSAAKNDVQDK
jgi:hypothetical protein